jgi:NOL1/NOP2/sun family putative RNA methylase
MMRAPRRALDAVPEALPEFLDRYRPLIDDWQAFTDACAAPLPMALWRNPRRLGAEAFEALLREEGLQLHPLGWNPLGYRVAREQRPGAQWWYLAGLAQIQEEAAQLPVRLLDPQPGERILDLCAAPGGKSAQIAARLANTGTVVANDLRIGRIRGLRGNLERLGLANVSVTQGDGTGYPEAAGAFDRVLVDAPCSGEGTLRKRSALAQASGPEFSLRLAAVQRALLRRAVALCRPGGRIVYSTCTFAPEENEAVVDAVLRELDGQVALSPAVVDGLATAPGLTRWDGQGYDASLDRSLRLWPHLNDTGGFYVAVLDKAEDAPCLAGEAPALTPFEVPDLHRLLREDHGLSDCPELRWVGCRLSGRGLYLTNPDHRPPPARETTGLRFARPKSRPLKLTTAAAMQIAAAATQGVVDLEREQIGPYLSRAQFTLKAAQSQAAAAGHVLVRYAGVGLGMGWYRPVGRTLESLFPKAWVGWVG